MLDPNQIPFLLKLLDDDTPSVHKAITKELNSFGPTLRQEIFRLNPTLNAKQTQRLLDILEVHNREELKKNWPSWFELKTNREKLEAAFTLLAEFQSGLKPEVSLTSLLDQLAEEFKATKVKKDAHGLCYFLFQVKELKGSQRNYYHPQNSNLAYVITEKQGLPISLVCIYMLVGARLGYEVEGCNFPGHFLARIELNGKKTLIDCFNGGRILTEQEVLDLANEPTDNLHETLQINAPPETIMARVLNNLVQAYEQRESIENSQLMIDLLNVLEFSALRVKAA